jgi:hypothetical protein
MRELVHEGTRGDHISISDSNKNNMNRKKNKPVLSSMNRRRVLKSKGFTEEEIDQASQQAEKGQKGTCHDQRLASGHESGGSPTKHATPCHALSKKEQAPTQTNKLLISTWKRSHLTDRYKEDSWLAPGRQINVIVQMNVIVEIVVLMLIVSSMCLVLFIILIASDGY